MSIFPSVQMDKTTKAALDFIDEKRTKENTSTLNALHELYAQSQIDIQANVINAKDVAQKCRYADDDSILALIYAVHQLEETMILHDIYMKLLDI